ncbi:MAG: DEAD/DEAH box helicase, partial [Lachnospiraceae bacterium]|nr:DEAD/DEAH box helicase [Lachnospiraceae bacterium]
MRNERKMSFWDAWRVKREAKKEEKRLKKLVGIDEEYTSKVKSDSKKLLSRQIEEDLKNIPVEELSKAKEGIRVQALKDAGIKNIYQLKNMSYSRIDSIKGVGEVSAKAIAKNVRLIEQSAVSNATVRINADKPSRHDEQLVTDLYKLRKTKSISNDAERLYEENHGEIKDLIKKSKPARNFISWTLASKEKREIAVQSLDALKSKIEADYSDNINELYLRKKEELKAKHEEIWRDYRGNAAGYLTTLERTKDKKASEEELKHTEEVAIKNGLPEELAVAIGNLPVDFKGLKIELRRYQEYGVKYIINQGAVLLGDEMGLGKTAEAIGAMVALHNTGATHFLVVCPASVLVNWIREVEKFSSLMTHKLHGKTLESAYEAWLNEGGVAVTTYETLDKIELPDEFTYSMLVVDEAHYVKNPKAERTQNLLYVRQRTDRVLFMTGTPIENNVEEMCFLIGCLQPEVAKTVYGSTSLAMAPDFRRKVSTVYFRRTREDVLNELPEKVENEEWLELTKVEKDLYKTFVDDEGYSKQRQVSWLIENPAESCKGQRLLEIVEEYTENNRKILIFSFF